MKTKIGLMGLLAVFLIGTGVFIGCKKTSESQQELLSVKGRFSLDEVVQWNTWYSNTIQNAPKIRLDRAQQAIIKNRYYLRVPLENSTGMIYFTKTSSLQAVFIRTNIKDGKVSDDPKQNMEFIDLNNFNYQVVTYKNGKPYMIYGAKTNAQATSSRRAETSVSSNSTFWFDLGCLLSFGIPRWNGNVRECWGINLWQWLASLFPSNDGSGVNGEGTTVGWIDPWIGGDPGLGGSGGEYIPIFGGNPGEIVIPWGSPDSMTDSNGYYYDRFIELDNMIEVVDEAVVPCDKLALFKTFSEQFFQDLTSYNPPQSVKDRIQNIINTNGAFNTGNLFLQTINNAKGGVVNCDFFPINITTLPTINGQTQTPEQFLEYFRLHMNDFISPTSIVSFNPYINHGLDETARWNLPGPSSLATLIHIPLVAVNDGTVIESGYSITGPPTNSSFTFSTMHSPEDDYHPVSGNRRFGIYKSASGNDVFYIAGVDRISTNGIRLGNFLASIVNQDGFTNGDILWRDIQTNLLNFINSHGGSANKFSGLPDLVVRPDWSDVEQYLKKQIDYQELRRRLGC